MQRPNCQLPAQAAAAVPQLPPLNLPHGYGEKGAPQSA